MVDLMLQFDRFVPSATPSTRSLFALDRRRLDARLCNDRIHTIVITGGGRLVIAGGIVLFLQWLLSVQFRSYKSDGKLAWMMVLNDGIRFHNRWGRFGRMPAGKSPY
jgi:hypothetical protein